MSDGNVKQIKNNPKHYWGNHCFRNWLGNLLPDRNITVLFVMGMVVPRHCVDFYRLLQFMTIFRLFCSGIIIRSLKRTI